MTASALETGGGGLERWTLVAPGCYVTTAVSLLGSSAKQKAQLCFCYIDRISLT